MVDRNFVSAIQANALQHRAVVCLELGPKMDRTPLFFRSTEDILTTFFERILDGCGDENILPNAIKPNYRFFAGYGFDGLRALRSVIAKVHSLHIPVILDAKQINPSRGAGENATQCFGFWNSDAIVVNPFLEQDSIEPLLEWCQQHGKGLFLASPTQNPFGLLGQVMQWNRIANGQVGALLPSTRESDVQPAVAFLTQSQNNIPLLLPMDSFEEHLAKRIAWLKSKQYVLSSVLAQSSSSIVYGFGNNTGIPDESASITRIRAVHKAARF